MRVSLRRLAALGGITLGLTACSMYQPGPGTANAQTPYPTYGEGQASVPSSGGDAGPANSVHAKQARQAGEAHEGHGGAPDEGRGEAHVQGGVGVGGQ